MVCPERTRLLEQYKHATKELAELSLQVWEAVGGFEMEGYQKAWHRWKAAWLTCNDLLGQLNAHIERHQCAGTPARR